MHGVALSDTVVSTLNPRSFGDLAEIIRYSHGTLHISHLFRKAEICLLLSPQP